MLINVKMPTIAVVITFISMLLNVKTPTIVGVITFISMVNRTSEIFKASKYFIF